MVTNHEVVSPNNELEYLRGKVKYLQEELDRLSNGDVLDDYEQIQGWQKIAQGARRIGGIYEHSHPTRNYCPRCEIRDGLIRLDKAMEAMHEG